MIASSTRTTVRSEGCCVNFSSVICQSTTLRDLHTRILHSSYRKLCVGTSVIKGARKTNTLGRDRRKHLLDLELSRIACGNLILTRSSAYVCEECTPCRPSNCGVGEEAVLLEQGNRSHCILVLPYHKEVDRGKICVGYRFDDAAFKHRRRCCELGPSLLDY